MILTAVRQPPGLPSFLPARTLTLSPTAGSVGVGATTSLTATARDHYGTTSTHPVLWSSSNATVATVSAVGVVTGVAAGSCTITAQCDDLTAVYACSVTGAALSAGDIVSEHFDTYSSTANMLADPRGIYVLSDDVSTGQIILDPTVGYGALTQSCRFDYPAQPGNCADYTITRSLAFPSDANDIYARVIAKWSPTWTNDNSCVGPNKDFKFIFVGVRTDGHRYNVMVGTFNVNYTVGYPGNEDGFEGGTIADWDGNWHTYWFHCKNAASGACAFARDSTVVKDYGVVDTSLGAAMYKITMARNINQGPPAAQSLWYGAIDVFSTKPAGCPL